MVIGRSDALVVGNTRRTAVSWQEPSHDFEKLVKGELPVLYRVARRMGCTVEEAEDVIQSALLKAYRAWHKFDGQHLRSWLIRIMRNERLMSIRGTVHTGTLDGDEPTEVPVDSFWDDTKWRLQADQLLNELDRLPEIYKSIIQLCDVEEMSYEEAATALEIPVGTVRSRLFRGRTMLRERLTGVIDFVTRGETK